MTAIYAFFATLIFVGLLGLLLGYFLRSFLDVKSIQGFEAKLKSEHKAWQDRLLDKETHLQARETSLDEGRRETDTERREIEKKKEEIEKEEAALRAASLSYTEKLSQIANLSIDAVKEELYLEIEKTQKESLSRRLDRLEREGKEIYEQRARDILAASIHRLSNPIENDIISTSFVLPDDETKGKIIGKEGRNIKSFERASGVQLVIDETPGIITISSFDPIRRVIAKKMLETLITDGRIQPARIEQVYAQTKRDIDQIIITKAREAIRDAKVQSVPEPLVPLLGQLYFRYSYGQNVLQHSVEMAHIAGILAENIGANTEVARMGALFHDIGKAVDHSMEGSHVDIGKSLLSQHGVDNEVIKAMQSHHEEYPYENAEALLVQAADAISGGRPGARTDVAGMYIQKLEGLERIALSISGVESAYAISAGREIRVFVRPESVDDVRARAIAKEIADQVEKELKYPGEIKIHVIRESRIVEFAR